MSGRSTESDEILRDVKFCLAALRRLNLTERGEIATRLLEASEAETPTPEQRALLRLFFTEDRR